MFVLAQSSAKSLLGPLLDTVCDRLVFVLRNLYKLAAERMRIQQSSRESTSKDAQDLSAYVAFHLTLRDAHERFIRKVAARSKDLLNQHLSAIISSFFDACSNNPHMYPSCRNGMSGSMRQMAVKFPQIDDTGDQMACNREVVDNDEGPAQKDTKKPRKKSPGRGGEARSEICDSQIAVPETPTPEQMAAAAKRKEYAIASGRLSAIEDAVESLSEAALVGKRKRNRRRVSIGKDSKMGIMQMTGNGTSSIYEEIFIMAAEAFSKIRKLLVERTVDTLNDAFLDPLRTQQAIAVQVEVFGVSDDKFLEMFVAPGALEKLEQEYATLKKRSDTLLICLHEFRTLAHSL